MGNTSLESLEKKSIQHFEKKDYKTFKNLFLDFFHLYPLEKTKYSNLVKSYFLILMLFEDFSKYQNYLNLLDYEDLDDENIKFVFDLEILKIENNFESLKNKN